MEDCDWGRWFIPGVFPIQGLSKRVNLTAVILSNLLNRPLFDRKLWERACFENVYFCARAQASPSAVGPAGISWVIVHVFRSMTATCFVASHET